MYNIVLVERDQEFMTRLTAYARESVYARSLSLVGLSEEAAIEAFFAKEGSMRIDLLVGVRELLELHGLYSKKVPVMTLVEEKETAVKVNELACKYSPAPELLARILRMCEAGLPKYTSADGRECLVYSVYSAAGGCGKSTVALNLAHLLASHNKSVCLLNLESLESFDPGGVANEDEEGMDFSRLLYEVISKPDCPLEPSWLAAGFGCRWFSPRRRSGMREWEELGEADTMLLLRKLAQEGPFDAIVLDLESNLHPRMVASLTASHVVFWLMRNDEVCDRKTKALLDELKREYPQQFALLCRTVKFGLNKHTGIPYRFGFSGFGGETVWDFELPYVPVWKNGAASGDLLKEPAFQARLLPLLGLGSAVALEAG